MDIIAKCTFTNMHEGLLSLSTIYTTFIYKNVVCVRERECEWECVCVLESVIESVYTQNTYLIYSLF